MRRRSTASRRLRNRQYCLQAGVTVIWFGKISLIRATWHVLYRHANKLRSGRVWPYPAPGDRWHLLRLRTAAHRFRDYRPMSGRSPDPAMHGIRDIAPTRRSFSTSGSLRISSVVDVDILRHCEVSASVGVIAMSRTIAPGWALSPGHCPRICRSQLHGRRMQRDPTSNSARDKPVQPRGLRHLLPICHRASMGRRSLLVPTGLQHVDGLKMLPHRRMVTVQQAASVVH